VVKSSPDIAREVDRYIRTGETDPHRAAWSGSFIEREAHAHADLRGALVREMRRFADGRSHFQLPESDVVALTRLSVEPMVRGLLPRSEQGAVLETLEKSVVFVTSANIESLILERPFDRSAWSLANLYLASVGADLLGETAPRIVGMSEGTTCFVSPDYFDVREPFADFVIHETAHVFHNCKRRTVGLPETRAREWLLDIEFGKRETFAYACEAYARIHERATSPAHRRALADEFASTVRISDEQADSAVVASIVREAAAARSGWKVIRDRCATMSNPRMARNPM
jgi:hypothetical protein